MIFAVCGPVPLFGPSLPGFSTPQTSGESAEKRLPYNRTVFQSPILQLLCSHYGLQTTGRSPKNFTTNDRKARPTLPQNSVLFLSTCIIQREVANLTQQRLLQMSGSRIKTAKIAATLPRIDSDFCHPRPAQKDLFSGALSRPYLILGCQVCMFIPILFVGFWCNCTQCFKQR